MDDQIIIFPDRDYPDSNLVLSVTDGQRNIQELHDVPQISSDGTLLRYQDVGYISFAVYDKQSNAAAETLVKLKSEIATARAEISNITDDYASLHQAMLIEREARANAQNERDALVAAVLKCDDDKCTSGDWIALVLMARGMAGVK